MKRVHVKKQFLNWWEAKLSPAEKEKLEAHLGECGQCREYFQRMRILLEDVQVHALPHLQSDPYLPARVRALAENDGSATNSGGKRAYPAKIRIAFATATLLAALFFGIFLGKGMAAVAGESSESELINAYSEIISQSSWVEQWDTSVMTSGEESQ